MRRIASLREFVSALVPACALALGIALMLGAAACARKDTATTSTVGDSLSVTDPESVSVSFAPSDTAGVGATPAPPSASSGASWRAHGNEPFWSVEIAGTKITWRTPEEELTGTVTGTQSVGETTRGAYSVASGRRVTGEVGGRAIVVTSIDRTCHDGMSGMVYPNDVTVRVGDREFNGCGGDPATLLQGREWSVVEIAGKPVVADSRVTMSFGEDGRVGGHASCNSYSASYEVGGEGVTFGVPVATLKACAEPLLSQETAFLGTLRAVKHFDAEGTGVLILTADDGRTIRATR